MTNHKDLFSYIEESLGIVPDYPFNENTAIFRHRGNRKWFAAVIFGLPKSKLGIPGGGECDIVDLKCDPFLSGSYRKLPGVLPGYHMNKEHWITVVLDGSVDKETMQELVNLSYDLTAPAIKAPKKS